MNTPRQIQHLVSEIVHAYASAQLELDPLPSGVCFLWVTLGGRSFVLEHAPEQGTGISENLADTPPFVGHDHFFASLDEAAAFFKQLLAKAAHEELSPAASHK